MQRRFHHRPLLYQKSKCKKQNDIAEIKNEKMKRANAKEGGHSCPPENISLNPRLGAMSMSR
jgi:hypothetical protein